MQVNPSSPPSSGASKQEVRSSSHEGLAIDNALLSHRSTTGNQAQDASQQLQQQQQQQQQQASRRGSSPTSQSAASQGQSNQQSSQPTQLQISSLTQFAPPSGAPSHYHALPSAAGHHQIILENTHQSASGQVAAQPAGPGGASAGGPKPVVGSDEWHRIRKDNHKEVERRRRETINKGILELAKVVPGCEKHKGQILSQAIDYIKKLKENEQRNIEKLTLEKLLNEQMIHDLSNKNRSLRAELEQAWQDVEHYKRLYAESSQSQQGSGTAGAASSTSGPANQSEDRATK